jgi:hypothetical protein
MDDPALPASSPVSLKCEPIVAKITAPSVQGRLFQIVRRVAAAAANSHGAKSIRDRTGFHNLQRRCLRCSRPGPLCQFQRAALIAWYRLGPVARIPDIDTKGIQPFRVLQCPNHRVIGDSVACWAWKTPISRKVSSSGGPQSGNQGGLPDPFPDQGVNCLFRRPHRGLYRTCSRDTRFRR